ncbi:MAG: hypothetical protein V2A73_12755 [Pseudomonadota bacterium]
MCFCRLADRREVGTLCPTDAADSAAVESANYHVTGTRLKLQGMRWDADGAARMAVLRADLPGDNYIGQWEERTRRLLAA